MKRWVYHSMVIRDLSIADSKLNAEGEKGWELVNICLLDGNSARAFFKRAIVEGLEVDNVHDAAVVTAGGVV